MPRQASPPHKNCHGVALARSSALRANSWHFFCRSDNWCHDTHLDTQGVGRTSEHRNTDEQNNICLKASSISFLYYDIISSMKDPGDDQIPEEGPTPALAKFAWPVRVVQESLLSNVSSSAGNATKKQIINLFVRTRNPLRS